MKKLLTILALLAVTAVSAWAQVHVTETGTNTLNAQSIKDKADQGTLYVAIQNHTTSADNYINKDGYASAKFDREGSTTWEVVAHNGGYALKNSEGQYIYEAARPVTFTEDIDEALLFMPTDCEADVININTEAGFNSSMAVRWKLLDDQSTQMNTNGMTTGTTVQFNTGTGNWTCLFTYEVSFKYCVVFNCIVDGASSPFDVVESTEVYEDGESVTLTEEMAPEFLGKTFLRFEPTSVTIDGANAEVNAIYEAASSITYTLTVTGAPEGTTLFILGDEYDITDTEVSASDPVTIDDVTVNFPSGADDYTYKVTIDGKNITVKCFGGDYAINFDIDQTYTRDNRSTTWVALGDQKIEWEFGGAGVEPVYRDMTDQTIKVPAGATVTPSIGYNGSWMHGFLYIDYNKNGKYDVDDLYDKNDDLQTAWSEEPNGELVSYKNKGDVLNNNNRTLPDITLPAEPGTYRARFKVDWASTNPGGNPGYVDEETGEFKNFIVDNGGAIIDVMIETVTGYKVTYKVVDASGETLAEKTTEVAGGVTIDAVPADLLLPDFYDYSEVTPVTVESNTTIITTATLKEEPLFQFTADTSEPVWYNLTIRPDNSAQTGYPTYVEDGEPNVALPNTLSEDETTQWAFIGSPYKGFTIVNNAAGTDLVLGAGNAFEDGGTGQYTNATLASPANDEYYYEIWMVEASSYAPNGFYLYNIFKDDEGNTKKQYLNRRSAENLAFWTNGKDMGSTFIATKPRTGADILADAQQLYDELTAGANSAQIGYPNAEALAAFKAAIDEAAETYNSSNDANTLKEDLATAIEEVKSPYNVNYTPRTDVYYTIANTRGAIVYDPEKFENVDGDGKEFLWFWDNDGKQNTPVDLAEFDKENPNNQWGIYEKDGNYYLYNVGTRLFANVTINAAEGKTIFSNDDFTGCWVFSRAPAAMTFDAGDETWVAAPNVRIYGSASVTDEWGNENEDIYYMSISPSYTGPVINYYAEGDGGVPMNFTVAATEQNPEVTAAIEALFDPNGIETIDNGSKNIDNGAVYNLQGQRVKKAQKGVYIQNGKKVVLK